MIDHQTDLVARAVAYAFQKHGSTLDKSGKLFMLHPLRVMLMVGPAPVCQAVAVLHDVVEDTDATLEDITYLFGEQVAAGVDAVTRRDDETYGAFIERSKLDPVGLVVKINDVRDNIARGDDLPDRNEAVGMAKRYGRALRVLLEDQTWAEAV